MLLESKLLTQEQVHHMHNQMHQIRPVISAAEASAPNVLLPRKIAVLNKSTQVTQDQLNAVCEAVQTQLDQDWQPVWNTHAKLEIFAHMDQVPANYWILEVLDNSDWDQALGYHGDQAYTEPYGKVFVKDALAAGQDWSVTFSHEVLEMMGNPWVNLTVLHAPDPNKLFLYALECCDAVQNDTYAYKINSVWVSNFQYPAWFETQSSPNAKLDQGGHCKQSFQILPGGYMPVLNIRTNSNWQSIYSSTDAQLERMHKHAQTRAALLMPNTPPVQLNTT